MARTVLLVEDQDDIRLMTRYMLESLGFEVIEARDGQEAVLAAQEHCPNIILMDVAMPVMNGITSSTLIRAAETCRDIPIIAVTAYSEGLADDPAGFGFDEITKKPVDVAELKAILQRHIPIS